ncbi:hypothetical protein BGZ74_006003, partial [Mortierella antarctica]
YPSCEAPTNGHLLWESGGGWSQSSSERASQDGSRQEHSMELQFSRSLQAPQDCCRFSSAHGQSPRALRVLATA